MAIEVKVKATHGNREFFGTFQREFKCGLTEEMTTVINTFFKQDNGEWKWSGDLGKSNTTMAFDSSNIEEIKDFPN